MTHFQQKQPLKIEKKILYIISSSVTVELNRVGLEVYWSGDSPEFTRRPEFDSYTGV